MARQVILGTFPLNDVEDALIVAEWKPDPEFLAAQMIQMADQFDDWKVPLAEAREVMIESTKRHFKDMRDPLGRKWIPLDGSYYIDKKNAGYDPEAILVRTGALKTYATSEQAWFIDERSVYFRAEGLPTNERGDQYGAVHQAGTSISSAYHRVMRTMPPERIAQFPAETQKKLMHTDVTGRGKGNEIPQRQFIGADEADVELLKNIFVKHMDNSITKHWDEPIEDWGPYGLGFGSSRRGEFPVYRMLPSGQPLLRTPTGGYMFGRMGGGYPL